MKRRHVTALLRARLARFPAAALLGPRQMGTVKAAIEIKLSAGATPLDLARLERAADFVSAEHRYVVCQTTRPAASATRGVLGLDSAIERLRGLGRARR